MSLADALDAIPIVANAAERAVRFPAPQIGQRVQNLATGAIERWNGAWVTDFVVPSVSADRGDQNVTLVVGSDSRTQRFATALTANRIITLSTGSAYPGARFRIVRTGLGAFTLAVDSLKTIPSATAAFVDAEFDGSTWYLTAYGTL